MFKSFEINPKWIKLENQGPIATTGNKWRFDFNRSPATKSVARLITIALIRLRSGPTLYQSACKRPSLPPRHGRNRPTAIREGGSSDGGMPLGERSLILGGREATNRHLHTDASLFWNSGRGFISNCPESFHYAGVSRYIGYEPL